MENWFFIGALLIISIFGILGNVFVTYVAIKKKLMTKKIWCYLLSLSFSDNFTLIVICPVIIAAFYDETILDHGLLCNFNGASISFLMAWSLFSIAWINLYKLVSIKLHFIKKRNNRRCFFIYVAMTFLLSVIFSVPPIFGFMSYTHLLGCHWCVPFSPDWQSTLMLAFMVTGFAVACIIVLFSNISTAAYVSRMTKIKMMNGSVVLKQNFNRRRLRVFQTTFFVSIIFVVLWSPLFVMILLELFSKKLPLWYTKLSYLLVLLQSCFNPIIYSFGHYAFKNYFKELVTFWRKKRNGTYPVK